MKKYKEFSLKESVSIPREITDVSFSFSDIYRQQFQKMTEIIVEELKKVLIGKLIFFRAFSENGKFLNASVKIRKIKDIKTNRIVNDQNILFIDQDDNIFEVFNTANSLVYYDANEYINTFLEKFKGKNIQYKKTGKYLRSTNININDVKDIKIGHSLSDDKHGDIFIVINGIGEEYYLPTYTEIKSIEIRISENDPYGEEDWD